MDLRKVFDCMISVSELGRGQASKVIQAVEDEGNPYIVIKNNKPQAVIVSIDEYTELMKARDILKSLQGVHNPFGNGLPTSEIAPYLSVASTPAQMRAPDYRPPKTPSLTEDEINIFLENEESD
ncbi:MAG: type II toxin-antitoxin system Phd/YefM family antitoxin [Desulfitobacteriia bacterium]